MLRILPDDDQAQIVDAVRRFADDALPLSRFRGGQEQARELARWPEIAGLGYLTMALPEETGGAGLGLAEEVLVFREFGRALLSPAALATTIAAHMLAARDGGDPRVAAIASGAMRAAPAVRADAGVILVIDGRGADLILLHDDAGLALFERGGLRAAGGAASLDDSLSLERVEAVAGPAATGDAAEVRRYALLIAALQVGIGEQARDMAVAYAKERVQFGKPIGAFQAIKHRCADMAVASEMAYAQLLFATIAERDGVPGSPFQVHAACLLAGRAAVENGTGAIQVHGGIGFTAEYDAHRLVKRARVLERMAGGATDQRAALLAAPFPA